jgi:ABC-2 type transport system ATP-binding protein
VLWATHLLDEIGPGDDLVILHHGRVLAQGPVARIIADAGTQDINAAFMRLTATAADSGSPSP